MKTQTLLKVVKALLSFKKMNGMNLLRQMRLKIREKVKKKQHLKKELKKQHLKKELEKQLKKVEKEKNIEWDPIPGEPTPEESPQKNSHL